MRHAVVVLLLIWPLGLWWLVRNRPPWGDEIHFLETVRLFGQGVTLNLLESYPEMSGPLTYLTYAAWGHVLDFSTPALRLLSPFVAWVVAVLWLVVVSRFSGSHTSAAIGMSLIVLNPYFIGLSVFVFTDMLALLGMAIVVVAVLTYRPWMLGLGIAVATCSRQYLAFLVPATIAADWLASPGQGRSVRQRWSCSIWALIGMLPLTLLVWLWGGHLAPRHELRDVYLSEGLRYDPHALSLYLAVPGAYLIPLVAPIALKAARRLWVPAALAAVVVWAYPIQPSMAQTREGSFTVGFLHRALVAMLPEGLVNWVFVGLAALTCAALLSALVDAKNRLRSERLHRTETFLWAATGSFLIVMPFSYLPWEKYALPMIVLLTPVLTRQLLGGSTTDHRTNSPVTTSPGSSVSNSSRIP